jgi:uncharacterized protein YqgV (UPF0045/DUF77 family)
MSNQSNETHVGFIKLNPNVDPNNIKCIFATITPNFYNTMIRQFDDVFNQGELVLTSMMTNYETLNESILNIIKWVDAIDKLAVNNRAKVLETKTKILNICDKIDTTQNKVTDTQTMLGQTLSTKLLE